MELDFNLLKCFKVVVETGSITAASTVMHLSQPAISLQLKRLEDQIGQKLFDRHNRGLLLTPFGQKFLGYSKRFSEFEAEMKDLLLDDPVSPQGKIRIGTYTTASSYLLARPVSEVLSKYKKLSVSYVYEPSERIVERIKDYSLDCAVLSDVPADAALLIEPIIQDELILAQSTKRKRIKNLQPKELSGLDFLSYPLRFDLCYRTVEQKFGTQLAKARVVAESESFDTLKQMLLNDAGVTFIPRYLIKEELKRGEVAQIQLGTTRLPFVFSFVTKRNSNMNSGVSAVREALLGR